MSSPVAQKLFQQAIRAAESFKDKNFREYFTRIVKDDFHKFENGLHKMSEAQFIQHQQKNLEVLERQSIVQNLYHTDVFSVRR